MLGVDRDHPAIRQLLQVDTVVAALEADLDERRRSLTLVMLRAAIAADFARLGMAYDVDAEPPAGGGHH